MQSVSPVFTEAEVQFEYEIAKNQPEYVPVIGLPVTLQVLDRNDPEVKREVKNWAVAIRFRLSPEERAQVAAGLDLVVTQLVFGKALHPMNFQLCQPGTKPVIEITPDPPAAQVEELYCPEHDLRFGPDTPENQINYNRHMSAVHGIYGSQGQLRIVPKPEAPSAADLDAVAAEQEAANQTEQPAPEEDQPQS